jgi:hypothetical protein
MSDYSVDPGATIERLIAEREALQVLLTAADERADVLKGLLRRTSTRLREGGRIGWEDRAAERIESALKPAEGGWR